MNILRTFEIFLREPLTILRQRFVQIVNIQTASNEKCGLSVDLLDKKAQISVFNSDKMYTLLRTALYKESKKESQKALTTGTVSPSGIAFGQLIQRR